MPGKNLAGNDKATALPFFHRLRPPDKHHRKDALISGGETRQDYKDTRRFPLVAPSCAFLFPSCGIRVVVEALPKSPRPVPFRQFAPSWAVCKNPPFSPTAAPYPVTIVLSPTRKDTTKRHWQQPLVTGVHEKIDKRS